MWLLVNSLIQLTMVLLWFVAIWMMVCNQWTYRDINAFLTAIRYRPFSGPAILAAFQKVRYDRHLLARMMFRDPWKLYDPIVKAALDNPVSELPVAEGVRIEIDAKGYASYGEQSTKH